jgi:ABC-type multidrug transport system fused ATPase/permease subunit
MSLQSSKPVKVNLESASILWRCFLYLQPYWKMTLGIYIAMLVITLFTIYTPQLIRWIIDRGIYGGDFRLLNLAVLGLLGMTVLKGVVTYFQGNWTEITSQNVARDLRNEIQRKLDQLSFSFHDQMQSGQVLSRTIQDVERIRFLTGRAVLRLVEGAILLIGTGVMLIWMNPSLGILVVLILPFLLHRAYVFGRRFRPLSLKIQDQLGVLTTHVEQNLRGALVVKGFAQEEAEHERFLFENEKWFKLSIVATRLQAVNVPLLNLLANFGTVIILMYGGILFSRGEITLGVLVAFISYLAQLVRPLSLMGRVVPMLAIAASSGERIFDILDAPMDVTDAQDAIEMRDIKGYVRFEGVSFGYNPQHPVIKGISFEVKPGQMVALLGATGSGKSTIINLLSRFYNPTVGRVTIDDVDTQSVELRSLRRQIGFVLQDTWLLAASVRENIAFGVPQASELDIIEAAREAQAHEFIMDMPQGYDTLIGERGVTLSGGQKQRIAIARALLTDPRILVLDDATSSVDTETERLIQQTLARLMQKRTTFVIAHRLSTVRNADLILVLEKGQMIASGTHHTLIEESPQYAEIYRLQLRPAEWALAEGGA